MLNLLYISAGAQNFQNNSNTSFSVVTCPYFMSHCNGPSKSLRMLHFYLKNVKISDTSYYMMLKWRIVLISISLVIDCVYILH